MVDKQKIIDYAGRRTLPGDFLLEIIFGNKLDYGLVLQWRANRWYLEDSSSEKKESIANERLVEHIVARFHPFPNSADPEKGLMDIEFDVQEFCPWLLEKVREIPGFALSHSARLFVDTALGISKKPYTETNADLMHHEKQGEATNDSTSFLRDLRIYCENDVEIKIQASGQRAITCNPDSLGFRDAQTKQWVHLISLLKSEEGTFSYSSTEAAKKRVWGEIEKKLKIYLKTTFALGHLDDLKLFIPTAKTGVRKPLFQISRIENIGNGDFSSLGKEEVVEKIKELANNSSQETVIPLTKAVQRAKELGFTNDELSKVLDTQGLLSGET